MGPPFKKQRFTESSFPSTNLHARRAQNDMRLKSIFESIFEKYGRDFDGIGDEIDMQTGEIVVDNGHIRSMISERDVGNTETSSQELGDANNEDSSPSIEYREKRSAASRPSKAGEIVVIEDSQVSEHSDSKTDSLMGGQVPAASHRHQLSKHSWKASPMSSDDEEDELASSDAEWVSYNKDRIWARERLPLRKDQYACVDEPPIDPLWRAPPLPNGERIEKRGERVKLPSVAYSREYSDDERAGISLWTPVVKKRSRRGRKSANSMDRSLPFSSGQEDYADGSHPNSSDFEPPQKKSKWTQKEDELLAYLKVNRRLSFTDMERYFPERQASSIKAHWYYVSRCVKLSSKPQFPTLLEPGRLSPSPSSDTASLDFDEIACESHDIDENSKAKTLDILQQRMDWKSPEAGSPLRSSSKATEHPADHPNRLLQDGRFHRRISGDNVDGSILIAINDDGARNASSIGNPVSSAKKSGCRIDKLPYKVNSNEVKAAVILSHSLSEDPEIEHKISTHKKTLASTANNGRLKVVPQDSCASRVSSPATSNKAQPNSKGLEPYNDGIVSPRMQPQEAPALTSNWPRRHTGSHFELQDQGPVHPIADVNDQGERSTAEGLRRTRSMNRNASTSLQPPSHNTSRASDKSGVKVISKKVVPRDIVQVVIPMVAKSHAIGKRTTLLSADKESEDPVSIRRPSGTPEGINEAPGSQSHRQENTIIRTPTRSPSITAVESQHAASAAFFVKDVSSSLGVEIADSQPLSTTSVRITPAPRLGSEATRPIILDRASPPIRMSPQTAPLARKQPENATDTESLAYDSQPLRVTPGIRTLTRMRIQEVVESDIIESGSHSLSKPLSAIHSPSRRAKKETTKENFPPILLVADDYSEDELSYLT